MSELTLAEMSEAMRAIYAKCVFIDGTYIDPELFASGFAVLDSEGHVWFDLTKAPKGAKE